MGKLRNTYENYERTIKLQKVFQTQNLQSFSTGSIPIREATERLTKIISAEYHKTNLHEYCNSSTWLTTEQQSDLYELLYKYKSLFDGTLGTWMITMIVIMTANHLILI